MLSPHQIVTEIGRLFRFGVTGIISAISFALTSFLIVELEIASPMGATAIAYWVSTCTSYYGHVFFSFRVKPDHKNYFWRFALTTIVTFGMTIGVTWVTTEILFYPFYVAVFLIIFLIPTTSYLCSRFWVFLPGLKG